MTRLSDVPFTELRSDPDWLIGSTGEPGYIADINVMSDGNGFKVLLYINWRNGNTSFPIWPDECQNVMVDDSIKKPILKPIANYQIGILKANIDYISKFTVFP